MSRLRELVDELCPDGVEYKTLGDLLSYEQPGKYIVKSTNYDDSYETPVLTAGQAFILGFTDEKDGLYDASTKHPVIIFDDFTTSYHWVDFSFKVKSSAMKMLTAKDENLALFKYIFYAMQQIDYTPGEHARQWISVYSKFRIPVPPIEVQREVVRILDSFQELDDALTTEIEAREKQFEYMLEREFDETRIKRVSRTNVDKAPLGCVRERVITPIRAKPTDFTGTIPWCKLEDVTGFEIGDSLSGKAVSEETVQQMGLNVYPEGTVLASCSATLGVYCITQKPLVTNQRFMGFVCGNRLHNRYLMYALKAANPRLMMQATTGTNAYISRKAFDDCLIMVPEIDLQKRISNELDCAYEHLRGLRAERDARRKQFEHYRDRLLSFPEKEA